MHSVAYRHERLYIVQRDFYTFTRDDPNILLDISRTTEAIKINHNSGSSLKEAADYNFYR